MLACVCKLGRSFFCAFRGLRELFETQTNARIHALATVAVLMAGFWLHFTLLEWAVIALAIAMVIAAEALNTALEILSDRVCPDHDPAIGRVKDMAAGAVVVAATGAAVVGVCIFLPHFIP